MPDIIHPEAALYFYHMGPKIPAPQEPELDDDIEEDEDYDDY